MIDVDVKVNVAALDQLAKRIQTNLAKAVAKTAFQIEQDAKEAAPVDTGALRASIFTVTSGSTGQAAAMAGAGFMRPGVPAARWDGQPSSPFEAFVVVGVEYGIYQEFGAAGRPGRFYLTGAGAQNRAFFEGEVRKALQ